MQLTSITINGVEHVADVLLEQTTITHAVNGEIQTGEFTVSLRDYGTNAVVGQASVGDADVDDGIVVGSEIIAIGDGERQFAGRICQMSLATVGGEAVELKLTCQDYTWILDTVVINDDLSLGSFTDKAIVEYLFANYLPGISVSADVVVSGLGLSFEDVTLREAMEIIRERTGADWYVDFNKVLQYHAPGADAAPFGFSEDFDGVTTFGFEGEFSAQEDFSNPANTITVRGRAAENFSTIFPVPGGDDDGNIYDTGAAYPPTPPASTADITNGAATVSRSWTGFNYEIFVSALRFDTSEIPDDCEISSATLVLWVASGGVAVDGGEIGIEYYDASNWPLDITDYDSTAPVSPTASSYTPITNFTYGSIVRIPLSNLSSISKTGYTGFRMHAKVTGTPAGYNAVSFAGQSHASGTRPTLEVNYFRPEVTGSYTHDEGVSRYGTLQATIIDRGILTDGEADLRAEYEASLRALPAKQIAMSWYEDGIKLGHAVPIDNPLFGLDGDYVCKKLTMTWTTGSLTLYQGELGRARPDLIRLIRRLAASQ